MYARNEGPLSFDSKAPNNANPTVSLLFYPLTNLTTLQLPSMHFFGLIDKDTPKDAYTRKSLRNGASMELVFSDEFNQPGRSFYPGDDPYWEAVDLHYWVSSTHWT